MPGNMRRAVARKRQQGRGFGGAVSAAMARQQSLSARSDTRIQLESVDEVDMSKGAVRQTTNEFGSRSTSLDDVLDDGLFISLNEPRKDLPQRTILRVNNSRKNSIDEPAVEFQKADEDVRKSPYYADLLSRDRDAHINFLDWFAYKVSLTSNFRLPSS